MPPFSVATGDFDGDSYPDLAVVNLSASNVSILINSAAPPPTFSSAATNIPGHCHHHRLR